MEPVDLESDVEPDDVEPDDTDSSIVNPFNPEDIDVITRTPNVNVLLSRLSSGRLDLAPDFQRRVGIWSTQKKSRLIESILLKIPLPTMYAADAPDHEDTWLVVDGVQRLSTIASFVKPLEFPDPKFTRLTGLEYLKEYEDKTFDDLSPRLKARIDETEFVLNLIRRGTPAPVMFNIFARINTGGSPLTRQELRHALTPGEGRVVLANLAVAKEFVSATGGRVRDDRMEAREMILRFIAFHLLGVAAYEQASDFDSYLTDGLKRLSSLPKPKRVAVERKFKSSLNAAQQVFGAHAFRKSLPGYPRRAPVNKALFETVLVALAALKDPQRMSIVNRKASILQAFELLLSDNDFMASISQGTGDLRKVQLRHTEVGRAIS